MLRRHVILSLFHSIEARCTRILVSDGGSAPAAACDRETRQRGQGPLSWHLQAREIPGQEMAQQLPPDFLEQYPEPGGTAALWNEAAMKCARGRHTDHTKQTRKRTLGSAK